MICRFDGTLGVCNFCFDLILILLAQENDNDVSQYVLQSQVR